MQRKQWEVTDQMEKQAAAQGAPDIKINTAEIPDHIRDGLAASTLDFIHAILRQPGGREALDARTAARKATLSAAK